MTFLRHTAGWEVIRAAHVLTGSDTHTLNWVGWHWLSSHLSPYLSPNLLAPPGKEKYIQPALNQARGGLKTQFPFLQPHPQPDALQCEWRQIHLNLPSSSLLSSNTTRLTGWSLSVCHLRSPPRAPSSREVTPWGLVRQKRTEELQRQDDESRANELAKGNQWFTFRLYEFAYSRFM